MRQQFQEPEVQEVMNLVCFDRTLLLDVRPGTR
jgi:hypothetical protein